jgi:hypothetical protein
MECADERQWELLQKRIDSSFRSYSLESGTVLVREGVSSLFLLNEAASRIWLGLVRGESFSEFVADFARVFGVSLSRARDDTRSALETWSRSGIFDRPDAASDEERTEQKPPNAFLWEQDYALNSCFFRLRFSDRKYADHLRRRLASLKTKFRPASIIDVVSKTDAVAIYVNSRRVEETFDPDIATGLLFRELVKLAYPNKEVIALLHAAAVVRQGKALVLAGQKASGKTTLTMGLLQRGFSYLSDDFVPLARGGEVLPMPFCLALKQGSWPLFGLETEATPKGFRRERYRKDPSVAYLTPQPLLGTQPARSSYLTFAIFPRFRPGCRTRLQVLSPTQTLERMVEADNWLSLNPLHVTEWISLLESREAYSLEFCSLSKAIGAIGELVPA